MMSNLLIALDGSLRFPVSTTARTATTEGSDGDSVRKAKYLAQRIFRALLDAAVPSADVCKDPDARYLCMLGAQLTLAAAILEWGHEPRVATADLRTRSRELREYLIGTNAKEVLVDLFHTVDALVHEVRANDLDARTVSEIVRAEFLAEYPREGKHITPLDICAAMRVSISARRGQKKWQSGAYQDIALKLGIAPDVLRDDVDRIRRAMNRPFGSSPLLSRVLLRLRRRVSDNRR
jgi:hypothetical protein